jgi:acetylornithine/N-succinyldiaminopimelate aminotransferase
MAAVGCAIMDAVLAPGFLADVVRSGDRLTQGLRALSARHSLGEVRGRGLLVALDLGADIAPKVVEMAMIAGVLLNGPRPNLLRFMPALNVTDAEIDTLLKVLEDLLRVQSRKSA